MRATVIDGRAVPFVGSASLQAPSFRLARGTVDGNAQALDCAKLIQWFEFSPVTGVEECTRHVGDRPDRGLLDNLEGCSFVDFKPNQKKTIFQSRESPNPTLPTKEARGGELSIGVASIKVVTAKPFG
jgi:hypothetical protein